MGGSTAHLLALLPLRRVFLLLASAPVCTRTNPKQMSTPSEYLTRLRKRIPGVFAILVNHYQGPELLRAVEDNAPDFGSNTDLAAAIGVATEQLSKIEMKNRSLVAFCTEYVVVHLNHHPLVLTFIAHEDGAIGIIMDMADEIRKELEPMREFGSTCFE